MSFDARSRERLEALGRQLPKKLPLPATPTATPTATSPAPSPDDGGRTGGPSRPERRHRVETERDPERLFRELMNASPDGTVPPHLLERLKQLEEPRRPSATAAGPATAAGEPQGSRPIGGRPATGIRSGGGRTGGTRAGGRDRPRHGDDDQSLYTAFQQLLLEDEEAG